MGQGGHVRSLESLTHSKRLNDKSLSCRGFNRLSRFSRFKSLLPASGPVKRQVSPSIKNFIAKRLKRLERLKLIRLSA